MVTKHFPETKIEVTDRAPDNRDYRVDASRVERELGFRCESTVEDAFLQTAQAVLGGVFHDPFWPGHSAIPIDAAG